MNTYGVPTGGVPSTRREDEIKERNRLANIAASERLRYAYMEAKEREDDRIESEAFADIVSTMRDSSALDTQVAGDHYKKMKIQPVEFIHANNIPFIEGCIIKYAARWRDKGGIKDIEKIIHFAQLLIELETKK
jgi:hypothetical protein